MCVWSDGVLLSLTCVWLPIVFLESTFLVANAISEATDVKKQDHTNLSSFAEARPTPPTTGTNESHTRLELRCPRKIPLNMHAQNGPALLTTCTNDTEPNAVASTPVRWPIPWNRPIGNRVRKAADESFGGVRIRKPHKSAATTAPPPTCAVAMLSGKPKAMCACLFLTE